MSAMILTVALFAGLSSEDFETREKCQDELLRLVDGSPWGYGPRVEALMSTINDPETARRMLPIHAHYRHWFASSYVPTSVKVWPVCSAHTRFRIFGRDVSSDEWPTLFDSMEQWLKWLMRGGWEGAPVTEWYEPYFLLERKTTELHIREMLIGGATYEQCDRLLERMWRIESQSRDAPPATMLPSVWNGGYLFSSQENQ